MTDLEKELLVIVRFIACEFAGGWDTVHADDYINRKTTLADAIDTVLEKVQKAAPRP